MKLWINRFLIIAAIILAPAVLFAMYAGVFNLCWSWFELDQLTGHDPSFIQWYGVSGLIFLIGQILSIPLLISKSGDRKFGVKT